MLARDVALIGRDQPFAIRLLRDTGNRRVAINRAPALPRALCQCLSQIGRLNIAIIGMLNRAQHTIHIGQRPDVLDLTRRQEIDINTNRSRNPCIIMIFIHTVFCRRQPNV